MAEIITNEKKKVLSCIQPSGMLTLGNYLGALKNWKICKKSLIVPMR